MLVDCLILGDSIAVGVGQDRPACTTVARVGITSGTFVQTLLPAAPKEARSVVISLGVNDDPSMNTAAALRQMRRGIQAAHVTWLLPGPKEAVRQAIRTVAAEHGDRLVDTSGDLGPDHLHPTGSGYRRLAALTAEGDGATTPPVQRPPTATAAAAPPGRFAMQPPLPRVIYLLPPSNAPLVVPLRREALNWPPPQYLSRAIPLPPRKP
jgi:lysophospholipase L1-like esterase